MKLPNVEAIIVEQTKLVDYLLSETHPDGSSKAAFFIAAGFSAAHWHDLADSLRRHAENDVIRVVNSAHGVKYVIEGYLQTPNQSSVFIRSVWIIESGHNAPRLVTAYPLS